MQSSFWRSTKDGKHFKSSHKPGISSNDNNNNRNNNTSLHSGTQPSPVVPLTKTMNPRRMTSIESQFSKSQRDKMDSVIDNDRKTQYYLRSLPKRIGMELNDVANDAMQDFKRREFLIKNLNKINNTMCTNFTEQDVIQSTISGHPNIIYDYILERLNLRANELSVISPKIKKYESAKNSIQTNINDFYQKRLDNTDSLYRATTAEELDSMVRTRKIGGGHKGEYDFVSVTTNRDTASRFESDTRVNPVIVEYDKKSILPHLVNQGYEIGKSGEERFINSPQGIYFVVEEEHRLPKGKIKTSDVKMKIHVESSSKKEKLLYQEMFGRLGELVFE